MSAGRAASPTGPPTLSWSIRAPRSTPGATHGSTRPARSGRCWRGQAPADHGGRAARHLDAAGHPRPGYALPGRAGRAQAAAVGPDGGRGRWRQPRAVVRAAAGRLRAGLPELLSRHRRPPAGGRTGQRHLPGRASSRAGRLSPARLWTSAGMAHV